MALKIGDCVVHRDPQDRCHWGLGEVVGFNLDGYVMVQHANGRCGSGPNGEGLWTASRLEVLECGSDRQVARKVMRDIAQDPTVPAGTRLDAAVTLIQNA